MEVFMRVENPENELDYFASYYICKGLYQDGIINFEEFDRINRANAQKLGVEPIVEFSHIRLSIGVSVE